MDELITRAQVTHGATATLPRQPERRLAAAVLMQAIEDLIRLGHSALDAPPRRDPRVRMRPVLSWFASDDVTWPYSFVNVCSHLRLEPAAVRACLRRYTRATPPPASSLQRLTSVA